MSLISELSTILKEHLDHNKARIDCLAQMVIALLRVRKVNLVEWAMAFNSEAENSSSHTRIKRFFRHFELNFDKLAILLFTLFNFIHHDKWYLTLDRTTWIFRDKPVNILMLGVAYKGISIPLYWRLLNTKGATNHDEKVELIDKFIHQFGHERIGGLLGDFAWAHKVGEWKSQIKPILIKNHGRKTVSIFRYGLDHIRSILFDPKKLKNNANALLNILINPPPNINSFQEIRAIL